MDDKEKNIKENQTVSITEKEEDIVEFEELRKPMQEKESVENREKSLHSDEVQKREGSSVDKKAGNRDHSERKERIETAPAGKEKKEQTETAAVGKKKKEQKETAAGEEKKEQKETAAAGKEKKEQKETAPVREKKTEAISENIAEVSEQSGKRKENQNEKGNAEPTKKKSRDTGKNAISQSKRLADAKVVQNEIKEKPENASKEIGGKTAKIAFVVAASVVLIAYFTGFIYFSGHFYGNAALNGLNVSGKDKNTARQSLNDYYDRYVLNLETIDGEKIEISGKDISMEITLHDDFANCLKQQKAYIWFVNLFKQHEFQIGTDAVWNEEKLDRVFEGMSILNTEKMTAPADAFVGVQDGKYTIVKEIMGNTIDVKKFKTAVKESLKNVQTVLVLLDNDCYKLPKVYDSEDSLKKELEYKNELAKNEIKLQLDDLLLEPGIELYDTVLEKKGDSFEISEKLVKQYVASLAEEYDTMGKDRTFTTSFDGKKVEISGTAFGYEMDQEETAEVLYKALKSGKAQTVEVSFENKGYTLTGENDIGDTYIEVNLSEQKVYAYKNGKKIAEGDCVSGNESAGNGTCIGLYAIQNKLSPTILRGEKKPVTKTVTKKKNGKKVKETTTTYEYEYESPVTFWMQFNGGIGLHDAAQWRSVYGGSIYYYSGSHGCVNLPYDLADTLYQNFEIGDPVVVYFWDNENRK